MSIIQYNSTLLEGMSVMGKMKPDKDGYYTVCVGALNIRNSIGAKYVLEESDKLFEKSSALMMRIEKSGLYAENGHPVRTVGMTEKEYFHRIHTIREDRACAHIKKVWLDSSITDESKDANERDAVAMMALIRPRGELKHVVEDAISSKDENLCFSLRGFTRPPKNVTEDVRILVNIVTWDCVILPGLSCANKTNSPSLEDISSFEFDPEIMDLEEKINSDLAAMTEDFEESAFDYSEEAAQLSMETISLSAPVKVNPKGSMFRR